MIPQLIVTGILLILPFITLPFGVTHFETPKVIIFELSTIVLSIVSILLHHKPRLSLYIFLYAVLFLLTVFDLIFRTSAVSFFGNEFRMQGIFLLWMLMLFSIMSGIVGWYRPPQWIVVVALLGMLLLGVTGLRSVDGRIVSTIGEPNALAGFVLFLWPMILLVHQQKKKSLQVGMIVTSFLIASTTIYLTGSRSGLLGLGIQAVFIFLGYMFRLSLSKTVIVCMVLFLISLSLPLQEKPTLQNQYENRADVWKAALVAGYAHPMLGWGFGNVENAMRITDHKLYNRVQGFYVDSAHNIFLDMWIQGGFVGVTTFIILLYTLVRLFVQKKKKEKLTMFLGLLVSLSFNPASVVELIGLWWLLGYVIRMKIAPEPL